MSVAARIAGFAGLLAVVFAAAAFAGSEIEPSAGDADEEPAAETADAGHGGEAEPSHGSESAPAEGDALPGLASQQDGLSLVLDRSELPRGPGSPLAFRIEDAEGDAIRDYDVEHERRMHLIVVRSDFQGFQHVHPRQGEDGTWRARIDTELPGTYRVFADFATDGRKRTLAADVFVPGPFEPVELAEPGEVADAGDGYEVELGHVDARPGEETELSFAPSRDGDELEGVQPYLGADGHLVILREGDQAYLHTHPEGESGGDGPIRFAATFPTAGRYRVYLQFKHDGEVRTAEFTQAVGDDGDEEAH